MMKELNKQILKYDLNNYRIEENSEEEDDSKSHWDEKEKKKHPFKNINNQISKPSKVYFYCPYNQTFTKFQNYDINFICKLIKKYQLENFFIIQIDNDNILYEEILKIQFKNESQIINKMFDLKLDYSFSPFQDSLFFNMSILTDFFYDQIEKYLIQIFFHNHGIYIINKDSCEDIHQILMEKFIFYFVNNTEFFEKSINDKNNKNKSTKILINDFKLKNIIQKFQEEEAEKTHKKTGNFTKNIGNINNKGQRKNGSLRKQNNISNNINTNKNNPEILKINSHNIKQNIKKDNLFNQEKNKIIRNQDSLIKLNKETFKNENYDEKSKYSKDMSFTMKNNNLMNLGILNNNLNDFEEDLLVSNSYHSSIGKNKYLIESLKNKHLCNDNKEDESRNKVIMNSDIKIIKKKLSSENFMEIEKNDEKNKNIKNYLKFKHINDQEFNKYPHPKKKFKLSLQDNFNSGEVEMLRLDSFLNYKDKYWDENNKNNFDINIENLNKEIMGNSRSSSMSSYMNEKEKEKGGSYYFNNNEMKKYKEKKLNLTLNKKRDSRKKKRENTNSLDKKEEREKSPSKKHNEEKKDKNNIETIILKSVDDNLNFKKNFRFDDDKLDNLQKYYCQNEKNFKEFQIKNEDSSTKSKSVDNNSNGKSKYRKSFNINQNDRKMDNNIVRNFSDKYSSRFNLIYNFKENEEIFEVVKPNKNKSHYNLENYSEELMDLKIKFNDFSTNNEKELNFEMDKENHKKNKNYLNYNNINNKSIPYHIDSSYNPEEYKKISNFYQDMENISSPYIKEKKDSEENGLLSSARENKFPKIPDYVIEIIGEDYNIKEENKNNESYFIRNTKKKISQKSNNHKRINFSTDELIYYLFVFSLEKLEEFTESLIKETDSLKGIYLELSEKERKDFFRRIHSMEVSMHIIFQETKVKKKFFKYAKNQFRTFNKLSNDFYFKNNFNFFLELMISKISQIELTFETLENFLKMIKENYLIIIEDNTEKENVKLNYVMKVLTVLTTIYAPMNIIPGLFGMNVKVPWVGTEVDSTFPFILICILLIILIIAQLFAFRKLKWF